MKIRLIKALITWLAARYPFLLREAVVLPGYHLHHDPRKKAKA
jgi:hypothetical protein